jgi:outer membrane lipoprotein LolB
MAGCATQQPLSDLDKMRLWQAHEAQNHTLDQWRFAGRLSVRLDDEAWSASLFWQQDNDAYNLRVVAPLARGSAEIDGDSDSVTLRTGRNEVYSDDDVTRLMQTNLGWNVPVFAMRYWLKGLPEPGTEAEGMALDDAGRLAELRQSGWQVLYRGYTRSGGYELPSSLQIQRVGITVRLSINSWTVSGGR